MVRQRARAHLPPHAGASPPLGTSAPAAGSTMEPWPTAQPRPTTLLRHSAPPSGTCLMSHAGACHGRSGTPLSCTGPTHANAACRQLPSHLQHRLVWIQGDVQQLAARAERRARPHRVVPLHSAGQEAWERLRAGGSTVQPVLACKLAPAPNERRRPETGGLQATALSCQPLSTLDTAPACISTHNPNLACPPLQPRTCSPLIHCARHTAAASWAGTDRAGHGSTRSACEERRGQGTGGTGMG